jgi:hypothetical protein
VSHSPISCFHAQSHFKPTYIFSSDRASTKLRSELSGRFLAHFTLSPQETDALNAKDVNITEQLFVAMDRVKKIREDCAELFTLAGVGSLDNDGTEGRNGAGDQDQEGDGVEGRDPALAA